MIAVNLFFFYFFFCVYVKEDRHVQTALVEFSKCVHLNLKLVCNTCTEGIAVESLLRDDQKLQNRSQMLFLGY